MDKLNRDPVLLEISNCTRMKNVSQNKKNVATKLFYICFQLIADVINLIFL